MKKTKEQVTGRRMNGQTGVYFDGMLAVIALTGLLACLAWKQRVGSSL